MSLSIVNLDRFFNTKRTCLICNQEFTERDNVGSLACCYTFGTKRIHCDHVSREYYGYTQRSVAQTKEIIKNSSIVMLDESNSEIHPRGYWHATADAILYDQTWNLMFVPLAYLPTIKFRNYHRIVHIFVGYDPDDPKLENQRKSIIVKYDSATNIDDKTINCASMYAKYLVPQFYNDEFRDLLVTTQHELATAQSQCKRTAFGKFDLPSFVSESNQWNNDEIAYMQAGSIVSQFDAADSSSKFYVPIAMIPRIDTTTVQ